ncbi:MAG: isopentenyl-diphosphate Delta-isomerase [Candidatus Micrarchaeia archaeon]
MEEQLILVDKNDEETGTEEKMKAHEKALLHRAFSIFVYNSNGEILLQKRAVDKYHSGGLWTNTCCSHPRPGEALVDAAHRRLKEEMGFYTALKEQFSFIYKVKFENNLWEHEYDHVLIGKYDGEVKPNPEEVEEYKWIAPEQLENDVAANPENYTEWFKKALKELAKRNKKSPSL